MHDSMGKLWSIVKKIKSKKGKTMQEALKTFMEISKIPHGSGNTQELKEWIMQRAKNYGAEIFSDKAGNILARKGNAKLCLQCHYDMVMVGSDEVKPEIVQKEGKSFLQAKDSSLGADNGAALACAIEALKVSQDLECLFTNDEEIGMLGAVDLDLEIHAPFILNCDSEDINEIVCSCAGGYDLEAKISLKKVEISKGYLCYEITTQGFCGGHSGIEIHKNIPNAIIELVKSAEKLNGILISFSGGEKRNSIPVNAKMILALPQEKALNLDERFLYKRVENFKCGYESKNLFKAILQVKNGVIKEQNSEVIVSSNLGIIEQKDSLFSLFFMGRGNVENLMQSNLNETQSFLEKLAFKTESSAYYAPWEREYGEFLQKVTKIFKKHNPKAELKNIHAGLECGILKQKFPKKEFVSIGPSIFHPHSIKEKMDLESFCKFNHILADILKESF